MSLNVYFNCNEIKLEFIFSVTISATNLISLDNFSIVFLKYTNLWFFLRYSI